MSEPLDAEEFMKLLTGDVVGIQVGERRIEVHQTLLNSVTDTFNELPQNFDVGLENVEMFQKFLAWLYSTNRRQQLETDNANALITLYVFGITLACESLKEDALHYLIRIMGRDDGPADSFFQAVDSMFNTAQTEGPNHHTFNNFHTLLDEISKTDTIDGRNIYTLVELYVKSVKWGNRNWHNWVINNIRDELDDKGDVLIFEQIKLVFDGTKAGNPLRKFCTALTYYQRRWAEGPIKGTQRLEAGGMQRRLKEIRGFMTAYLNFEDDHRDDFPGEPPKDSRDRKGEMDTCYFHVHKDGESCTQSMEVDE